MEDLREAARRIAAPKMNKGFEPKGLHRYTDPSGAVLYARIRLKNPQTGEKWIRPIHPQGDKWEVGEPTFPAGKPVYYLHHLVRNPGRPVYWVEGEQKVEALEKLGILATTAGSANDDKDRDFSPLANRKVTIWPDNDSPGKDHATRVAERLRTLRCAVEVLDVAPLCLPEAGDVEDWLKARPSATAEDIEKLPRLSATSEWPDPLPIAAHDEATPYPLHALPGLLGDAVREVVDFVQCPVALAACSALTAASTVVQGLANVRRAENLTGPASLFLLAIAESGERKSTCDGYFSRAIADWELEKAEEAKPDLARHATESSAWEAERDGLLAAIKQANSKTPPRSTHDLKAELRNLDDRKPVAPRVPRLIYKDATSQKLGERLATGWPSGAIISAEAGIVLGGHSLKGDAQMATLALLNSLWSDESFISDRRTTESYAVRGARLTLGLATQPETVRAFIESSAGLARGTGFLARFLIAWPTSTQGERPFRESRTWPHLSAFNRRIGGLLDMPLRFDERGTLAPVMLDMTPDAFTEWRAFHDEVERELRPGGDMAETRDAASKAADNAARLAAIFHVLAHGTDGQISKETVQSACEVASWHLYEARRFIGDIALPPHLASAAKLDNWLIRYCAERQTASVARRTVQQLGPSALRDGHTLDKAISILADLGRLRPRQEGREKWLDLNPVLKGDAHGPA